MRHHRPPALERMADDELDDLEHALEQLTRPGGRAPGLPWESAAGVRDLELVRELTTTGARQSRMAAGGGGAATPAHERPVPYVATANDLAARISAATVDLAAALMRAERRDAPVGPWRPGPPSLHVDDLAAWLITRLNDGAGLAWHPGIVRPHLAELRRLIARGRVAVDRQPERWYAGPCNVALRDDAGDLVIVNGAQARCVEDLYVRPHVTVALCQACHAKHHIDERRAELVRLAYERLETATDLSRALAGLLGTEVRAERIRQWKRRGRIATRGTNKAGDPLYRVGDVVDLVTADAARRSTVRVAGTRKAKA